MNRCRCRRTGAGTTQFPRHLERAPGRRSLPPIEDYWTNHNDHSRAGSIGTRASRRVRPPGRSTGRPGHGGPLPTVPADPLRPTVGLRTSLVKHRSVIVARLDSTGNCPGRPARRPLARENQDHPDHGAPPPRSVGRRPLRVDPGRRSRNPEPYPGGGVLARLVRCPGRVNRRGRSGGCRMHL
jgi:hypothetical protein